METVLPLPFIIQSVLLCYVILSSVCFGAVLLLWHEYRYVINIFWMNDLFFERVTAFDIIPYFIIRFYVLLSAKHGGKLR